MKKNFETLLFNRWTYIEVLDNFSEQQLNVVSEKFNNSLIWNIAHTMVTEQLLTYGLSGLPMNVDEKVVEKYRKGTRPEATTSLKEIDYIRRNLVSLINKTEEDYHSGIFRDFQQYPTSTGVTLNTIEDALLFNTFHEGIHLGVIMSLKKIV